MSLVDYLWLDGTGCRVVLTKGNFHLDGCHRCGIEVSGGDGSSGGDDDDDDNDDDDGDNNNDDDDDDDDVVNKEGGMCFTIHYTNVDIFKFILGT